VVPVDPCRALIIFPAAFFNPITLAFPSDNEVQPKSTSFGHSLAPKSRVLAAVFVPGFEENWKQEINHQRIFITIDGDSMRAGPLNCSRASGGDRGGMGNLTKSMRR